MGLKKRASVRPPRKARARVKRMEGGTLRGNKRKELCGEEKKSEKSVEILLNGSSHEVIVCKPEWGGEEEGKGRRKAR